MLESLMTSKICKVKGLLDLCAKLVETNKCNTFDMVLLVHEALLVRRERERSERESEEYGLLLLNVVKAILLN